MRDVISGGFRQLGRDDVRIDSGDAERVARPRRVDDVAPRLDVGVGSQNEERTHPGGRGYPPPVLDAYDRAGTTPRAS
ncbi:MAG: hypothetical protein JOZ24_11180 [Candidatus Eremiobacteraeota bacterium]|nr:hypothetical protein [Candidatus Eremiobacteraeota bacterium]